MKSLPTYLWIAPIRPLKRGHPRREACEAALVACRKLGMEETAANILYLVMRGLQTRDCNFLNEAIRLFGDRALPDLQRTRIRVKDVPNPVRASS
jgi:hypothetical protein